MISHFISDYEKNSRYTGFPQLGVEWQKMESPFLRTALGMGAKQSGVLVRRVEPTCPSSKFLKPNDILLSFDGTRIANDGSVTFRSGERISFSYLVSQKYTLDAAQVEILSGGKVETISLQLSVRPAARRWPPRPPHIRA